jgi:polysaccharide pyruvyl transferase WcaK-like protein
MTIKIIITGYYKKNNTGDDIFEKIANKLFISNKLVEYIVYPIETLKKLYENEVKLFDNINSVVLFGGETLNDYFLNTLRLIKQYNQNIKLYAIGVGLGTDIDNLKYHLPMFQYIIVRHKSDHTMIRSKFPNLKCEYVQDIAFMYNIKAYKTRPKPDNVIGLFLSQPKFYALNKHQQEIMLQSYVTLIKDYVKNGSNVKLFSMCYNNIDSESDSYLNNMITSGLDKKTKASVRIVLNQSFDTHLGTLKYAICERFHAHILCLIYNIPFISTANTLKVKHLLTDLNIMNTIYNPSTFEKESRDSRSSIITNILPSESESESDSLNLLKYEFVDRMLKSINQKQLKKVYKNTYPNVLKFYSTFNSRHSMISDCMILNGFDNMFNINDSNEINNSNDSNCNFAQNKLQLYIPQGSINTYCSQLLGEIKKNNKSADYILIKLFGTNKLEYKWGIEEKIKQNLFDLSQVKWLFEKSIMEHSYLFNNFHLHISHIKPITKEKVKGKGNVNGKDEHCNLFNIDYIDQYDRTGVHRHGWKYVVDNISSKISSYNPDLIKLDLYVDRTFHWNREAMIEAGIIPYKTPWIGVIHHTLYQDESGYNCIQLLKCKEFIDSLLTCRGLIVLSKYLRNNLYKLAMINNVILPKVYFIKHPTCFVDDSKLWKYGPWKINSWKGEVIQIGSWMRDIKAIYDIDYPQKYALIGKKMEDKYKMISFGDTQKETLYNMDTSVKIITYLENDMYDDILSRYVVFLKLKDASAVNTILECIARNTPIIVNRLPAVEEYLGVNYPLYYNTLEEVPIILKNKRLIVSASKYLSHMNKDDLKIEKFIEFLSKTQFIY